MRDEIKGMELRFSKGCIQPIGGQMNRPAVHVITECITLTHISCALILHIANILQYCGLLHKTLQPFHLNNSDIAHVPVFIISCICIVEFLFMLPDLQHLLSCTILIVMHKTSEAKSLNLKTYLAIDLILITGEPNSWVSAIDLLPLYLR